MKDISQLESPINSLIFGSFIFLKFIDMTARLDTQLSSILFSVDWLWSKMTMGTTVAVQYFSYLPLSLLREQAKLKDICKNVKRM